MWGVLGRMQLCEYKSKLFRACDGHAVVYKVCILGLK